jgi:hypothetical protein
MNVSKSQYKKALSAACLLVLLGSAGCTKKFDSFNTDKTGIPTDQLNTPSLFGPLETAIWSNYQTAQNLSADEYAGYMATAHLFAAQSNWNYFLNDGWDKNGFNDQYTMIMGPIVNTLGKSTVPASAPDLWAVALIIKVAAMDRVTDKFGPIPYSKVGTSLSATPYDSQDSVYNEFFADLDVAATNLQAYIAANPGKTQLAGYDLIYNGVYTEWLKFANSLRLRLAMHIVKAAPAVAQAQVQKALTASGGLLETPADDAAIAQGGGRENDLYLVSHDYGDNNLNAAMGCYLTGYKDPRLTAYAIPASGNTVAPAVNGTYTGIRIGATLSSNKTDYNTYANINYDNTFTFVAPQQLMTAAEVWFLRAEAALRGWSTDDPQTDYEKGIQTSMQQWGVSIGSYLSDATSKEAPYVDPQNAANNDDTVSTITIKWDPGATNEQKLERIITQKWLAMFPEGQEAWTEFRRTGYPKLFTVVNNESGGTVDTQIQIRRLEYPSNEYSSNGPALQQAITMLGGPDNGGTRLWWDINKGNF